MSCPRPGACSASARSPPGFEVGALIGPLWGGAITELWAGRWVFWVNVLMAALFMIAAWRLAGREVRAGAIDWPGAVLLGVAPSTLLTYARR
ncbi:MAG: hypothetical protein U0360_07135 [Dehalococcoidia bacterium]